MNKEEKEKLPYTTMIVDRIIKEIEITTNFSQLNTTTSNPEFKAGYDQATKEILLKVKEIKF